MDKNLKVVGCSVQSPAAASSEQTQPSPSSADEGSAQSPAVVSSEQIQPSPSSADEGSVQPPAATSRERIQPSPSSKSSKCKCRVRYGHGYGSGDNAEHEVARNLRENAWHRLLPQNAGESSGNIKQQYFDAIKKSNYRKVQEENGGHNSEPDHEFLEKQIQDGCLFIQNALLILGYELGNGENQSRDVDGDRIEEMFCVNCNEMPLEVLSKLMDQEFFQNIVLPKRWKWKCWTKTPSTFTNKALHELLVLPALKRKDCKTNWVTTCTACSLCERCSRRETTEEGSHTEYASHILHGLQNLLIFGPKKHLACIEHEIDIDLEANSGKCQKKDVQVSAVSPLRQSGIGIKKVKNGGIRSIDLQSYLLCACLYLPAFELDGNTEMILQNLIIYEKRYFRYHYQREVSSYIKFLSGIVQTKKDAKLLADKNIVVGDSKLVPELPAILRKLASSLEDDIVLTPQLQTVAHLIREYRPFRVFRKLFSLMLFLTFFQFVLDLLTFCHIGPKNVR